MKIILLVILAVLLTGCQTVKTYDAETGKKISSVPQDVAALQAQVEIIKAKTGLMAAFAKTDDLAQRYAVIRGDMWTDEMRSYVDGETAETNAMQRGFTGGLGWVFGIAAVQENGKTSRAGMESAGDKINTGDIQLSGNANGGAGGESVGGAGGRIDQSLQIGSGKINSAKDRGNVNFERNPINGDGSTVNDADNIQPSTGLNLLN